MQGTTSTHLQANCRGIIPKFGVTILVALPLFILSACGPTATATPTQAPVVTQITLAPVNSPIATVQATTASSGGTSTGLTATSSAPLQSTTGAARATAVATSGTASGSATAMATSPSTVASAQSTPGFVSSGAGTMATMSATEQALMEAAQAGCTDQAFMSRLSPDVSAASAIFKAFSPTSDAQIAASLIQVNILSQRYEDLANVPSGCAITQLAFVSALANYSDAVALALSAKAAPNSANAATYAQQIPVEMARANAFLTVVSKGVTGK